MNERPDVKCKCGRDCLNYHGSYLCPECDKSDVEYMAKEHFKLALKKAKEVKDG